MAADTPATPPVPPKANAHNPLFKCIAQNEAEEQAYDFVQYRADYVKFTSIFGSIAHIIKGALGAGVLGGHTGYMKAGALIGVVFTIMNGLYIFTTLTLLVQSGQILYRRCRVPVMSYPEIAEASFAACHNPWFHRHAKKFRYLVDVAISMDLFGACACYQIIIAKTLKQLIEDEATQSIEGKGPGYPHLRVYLAALIVPIILICFIRHLKYLAPFSFAANLVILVCMLTTVVYAVQNNPTFSNMAAVKTFVGFFEFIGMNVFGMSCIGVVIPIENNMKNPARFPIVLMIGMFFIILSTFTISFFGYAAYLEDCQSPITINYPMDIFPKIIKILIALMIYVTHALNFWVPFNISFHYIQKRIKKRFLFWEYVWRAFFVVLIAVVAIVVPEINALLGFIGCLCLSNMAFIWPALINTVVIQQRPGFGRGKWKLWRNIFLMIVGFIFLCIGSVITAIEMVTVFKESI